MGLSSLSNTRLKPSKSKYKDSLLQKPYLQVVTTLQLKCKPEFSKSSRYVPFLDFKYFPAFQIPFHVCASL